MRRYSGILLSLQESFSARDRVKEYRHVLQKTLRENVEQYIAGIIQMFI